MSRVVDLAGQSRAGVPSAPRLVGLLAAHFGALDEGNLRVDRFERLLRSVEAQTWRLPLLVSWSAEEGPVATRAGSLLERYEREGIVQALPRVRGQRSQFEHYHRLSRHLLRCSPRRDNGELPWVFFSDDDDVWHPRRAETYLAAVTEQQEKPQGVGAVFSRVHANPGFRGRLDVAASHEDVDLLVRAGDTHLSFGPSDQEWADAQLQGLTGPIGGPSPGEYFDYAVDFLVFYRFFRDHNARVLANTFADIRFRTWVVRGPCGCHRFWPSEAKSHPGSDQERKDALWMYHYDHPPEAYSDNPRPEDLRYLSQELTDLKRIAGMRQTLDCFLFQLASTSRPLRITERVFAKQLVGILKDQGPAAVAMALDRCEIHGVEIVQV